MRRFRILCAAGVSLSLLVAPACSTDGSREAAPKTTPSSEAAPQEPAADEVDLLELDPNAFDDRSHNVSNEWLPLKPGTQLVHEGSSQDAEERIPVRVVFTVTDLTKVIEGVRTVVVWERDYQAGELVEAELIFFAQDKAGNVWHFGQYSEVYDEDGLVGGRIWLVGLVEGATAGIIMKAEPESGTGSYSQGYAPPPYNWDDRSRVHQTGQKTCVPAGCFEDLLVTDEFEPSKPGAHQFKYYARGVGNVRVGWIGEQEQEKETLEFVKRVNFSPEALAEARAEALKLEERGYHYGRTTPAEQG